MTPMAFQAKIEGKKLTKQSAKETLVKSLKIAIQPRSPITGVTGYTNEHSFDDYKVGDLLSLAKKYHQTQTVFT